MGVAAIAILLFFLLLIKAPYVLFTIAGIIIGIFAILSVYNWFYEMANDEDLF